MQFVSPLFPHRLALLSLLLPGVSAAQVVDRVSVPNDPYALGVQANAFSELTESGSPISADNRYLVFTSDADNLAPGDLDSVADIYLKDRLTGAVQRVTPAPADRLAAASSWNASLSADAGWVAFTSDRTDLVRDDGNQREDVYLLERSTGETSLVSRTPTGASGNSYSMLPSISQNGRYVAFESDASDLTEGGSESSDVFVYDRITGMVSLASKAPRGAVANGGSWEPQISPNGRWLCFYSEASNLVDNDANGDYDVYLADLVFDEMHLASRRMDGHAGNGGSYECTVADSGEVAFMSDATDLVAGDTNDESDVFLFDPLTLQVELLSRTGAPQDAPSIGSSDSPSISTDGRRVAFLGSGTDLPGPHAQTQQEVYVRDRDTQQTWRISTAHDPRQAALDSSYRPRISPDGSLVAFDSYARDLVPDDSNGNSDVFVQEVGGTTRECASRASMELPSGGGAIQSAVSGDGSLVVFASRAPALLPAAAEGNQHIFLYDRSTRQIELVSRSGRGELANGASASPKISADGRTIAFDSQATNLVDGSDTNNSSDVFLLDRDTGRMQRASSTAAGNAADRGSFGPSLAADGSRVLFMSSASNLLPDTSTQTTRLIAWQRDTGLVQQVNATSDGTPGTGFFGIDHALSGNGRYASFAAASADLVAGVPQSEIHTFRKDLDTGAIIVVDRNADGVIGNGHSADSALSVDGRYLAFNSTASNLVPGDTNGSWDVFLADLDAQTLVRVSRDYLEGPAAYVGGPSLSLDGRFLAFISSVPTLVQDDTNERFDVFVYDRVADQVARASVDTRRRELRGDSALPMISADGDWLSFALAPGKALDFPGRIAAPSGYDVVLGNNPLGNRLFEDDFEP